MENAGLGKFLRPRRVGPPRAKIFRFHGAEPPSFPPFSWKKRKVGYKSIQHKLLTLCALCRFPYIFLTNLLLPTIIRNGPSGTLFFEAANTWESSSTLREKKKKKTVEAKHFSLRYTSIIYAYTMKMQHTVSSTRAVLSMPSFVMM